MSDVYEMARKRWPTWAVVMLSVFISLSLPSIFPEKSDERTELQNLDIDALRSDIATLQENEKWLKYDVNRLTSTQGTVVLSPGDAGYAISRTAHGTLYFALGDIKKYANGHKIIVNVGNPTATSFNEATLQIRYNTSISNITDWDEWQKSIKTKTFVMRGELAPATWSPFEIVLSPSTEEETGWIEISPVLNNVVMRTVPLRK